MEATESKASEASGEKGSKRVTKRQGKGPPAVAAGVDVAPARPIVTERARCSIREIRPGSQQYRRHFDERRHAELTESVKRNGVQSPPWVRAAADGVGYELIAGERRWRAAMAAGLEELDVDVKTYAGGERIDDERALELAILENKDRDDTHPLEEAEAFAALRSYGNTPEQIAAKVKRSPGYVYERLALEGLGEAGRKAMWAGQIPLAVGHALSRITHPKTQADAVRELTRHLAEGQSVRVAYAKDEIRRRWMLRIVDAPFSTSDETLVPAAGSCGACPKRSGLQGVLFEAALGKDNLCTDPSCWASKRAASDERTLAAARASGKEILSKTKAKELWPYEHGSMQSREFVSLEDKDYQFTETRSWGSMLGKKRVEQLEVVVAQNPHTGDVVQLVKRSAVMALLKKEPLKGDTAAAKQLATKTKISKKEKEKKAAAAVAEHKLMQALDEEARRFVAYASTVQGAEGLAVSRALLIALAAGMFNDGSRRGDSAAPKRRRLLGTVIERRKWADQDKSDFEIVVDQINEMDAAELRGLLAELVLEQHVAYVAGKPYDAAAKLLELAKIDRAACAVGGATDVDQNDEEGGDDGDE